MDDSIVLVITPCVTFQVVSYIRMTYIDTISLELHSQHINKTLIWCHVELNHMDLLTWNFHMSIDEDLLRDIGTSRCRVNYKNSAQLNSRVFLILISSPKSSILTSDLSVLYLSTQPWDVTDRLLNYPLPLWL
jgi:hypothetical protein